MGRFYDPSRRIDFTVEGLFELLILWLMETDGGLFE